MLPAKCPPAKKARPAAPSTTSAAIAAPVDGRFRGMLVAFYEEHNPQKLQDVDKLLQKYKGKEGRLFAALTKKYPHSVAQLGMEQLAPPAESAALIFGGKDGNKDVNDGDGTSGRTGVVPPALAAAGLPAGFFDSQPGGGGGTEDQTPILGDSTAVRGSLAREVASWARPEEDLRGNLKDKDVAIAPGDALPAGFFDDAVADAKAHNVDAKLLKKKAEQDDWKEFTAFTTKVNADTEVKDAEVKQEHNLEHVHRKRAQQLYKGRLQRLKEARARSKRERTVTIAETGDQAEAEAEAEAADRLTDGRAANRVGGSSRTDLSKMLKRRKKEKRLKEETLRKSSFKMIDPSDWRAKGSAS